MSYEVHQISGWKIIGFRMILYFSFLRIPKQVTTKRAVPRELFQAFDGILTVTKVFVGGLIQDIQEQDLREYFSRFGNVRRVDIMMDRNTNVNRGFGFVEFDDYDPVDKAVLQSGHIIRGKDVTVRKGKNLTFLYCWFVFKQVFFCWYFFANLKKIPFVEYFFLNVP